jgi:hypothetical protein
MGAARPPGPGRRDALLGPYSGGSGGSLPSPESRREVVLPEAVTNSGMWKK